MRTPKRTDSPTAYQAALLATDSDLLARVHEIATAHFTDSLGDILRASLNAMVALRDYNAALLVENAPKLNRGSAERAMLRANSSIERLTRRIEDLRCSAYRFARAQVYVQTGRRLCLSEWPDEAATETSAGSDNAPQPTAEVNVESAEPETQTHASRVDAPSNKQVKAAVRQLAQGGVSGATCEEFRTQAKLGAWNLQQMEAKVKELLAQSPLRKQGVAVVSACE